MIDSVAKKDYLKHISDTKKVINSVQWSDQYELSIRMIAPPDKEAIPPELIKSFSFKHKALNVDKIKIGTKSIKYFNEATSEGIDVVFYNLIKTDKFDLLKSNTLIEYLTRDNNGKKIIPEDGSYLLPDDWYFYIQAYQLTSSWKKILIGEGYYVIDSEILQDFMSSGGTMQEIPISFVPKD